MKKGASLPILLKSPKTVFSFKDLVLLWGESDVKAVWAKVHYYVKKGYLYSLRKGFYAKDQNYNKLEFATRIYTPAYVSFETILAEEGINFQFYEKITVASYLTRDIVADGQTYSFRKIKDVLLTNSSGIQNQSEAWKATKERAFLDTLYIHKNYHFDNLSSLNWDKVFEILPIYDNQRMNKKVKEFFEEYQ